MILLAEGKAPITKNSLHGEIPITKKQLKR